MVVSVESNAKRHAHLQTYSYMACIEIDQKPEPKARQHYGTAYKRTIKAL